MAPPEILDEPAASVQPAPVWSDRGAADTEVVGEIGLAGGSELVDVADQRRLREVQIEGRQASVERDTHEPRGRHQRGLHAEPRRRVEFVGGEVAHVVGCPNCHV